MNCARTGGRFGVPPRVNPAARGVEAEESPADDMTATAAAGTAAWWGGVKIRTAFCG